MSASTERKNRQAAREAGTDKKTIAAREAAEKAAKSKRKWTLGTIGVILLIACILLLNSSLPYTATTAVSVGGERFSPAEMNYVYANEYYNAMNSYFSYFIDSNAGLAGLGAQSCPMDGYETWKDYFLEAAENDVSLLKAESDYAAANGISLSQEDLDAIEENLAELRAQVSALGYPNVKTYLSTNYGRGVSEQIIRQSQQMGALAHKAEHAAQAAKTFTPEELEAHYQESRDTYDSFDFVYYFAAAATVETGTGDDAVSEPTDQTRLEAAADADAIVMAFKDGDEEDLTERFNAAVESQFEGQSGTARSAVSGSSLSSDYKEWLQGERSEGDITAVQAADGSGSYVVMFLSRSDNHYDVVQVRHILIMAEADDEGNYSDEAKAAARTRAEEILAQFQAGEQTEERFAELAEQYSEDSGSNTNGGLYDSVEPGQMVPEFDAFCFAPHEHGDTAIVYGDNGGYAGYHVVYYVGTDLKSNVLARNTLMSEYMQTWLAEVQADYEPARGFGWRWVG